MNQNRWTCLTTVVLTTVILPMAAFRANALTAAVRDGGSYSPLSPKSLPIITPLTVTELETEAAIPVAIKPVPQVSKLPIVVPLYGNAKAQALREQHQKVAKLPNPPTKRLTSQSAVVKRPTTTTSFTPISPLPASIFTVPNPIDSSLPHVNAVVPLPQVAPQGFKSTAIKSIASQTATAPMVVVGDRANPTVIQPATTVQAEEIVNPTQSPIATTTAIERSEVKTLPQVAPIVSQTNDSTELPSFESGLPVFVFDNERPQQIVATAIAQVDNKIVSTEPSIAIPVERSKQPAISAPKAVIPVPAVAPLGTAIVEIEEPSVTTQPALDKIVATQTGKASWYGIEGGVMTANGERYNPEGLTAAHPTLPFGTKVRVTSLKTGKFAVLRINDRGPFRSRRIIDISAGAARIIGIKNDGIGEVRIEVLGREG